MEKAAIKAVAAHEEESDDSISHNEGLATRTSPTKASVYAKRCLILICLAVLVSTPFIFIFLVVPKETEEVDSSLSSESSISKPSRTLPPSIAHMPTSQPSMIPTWEPVVTLQFQLRLYWEEGYYWQESREEMFYCMECARCEEYSVGDGWEGDCRSPGSSTDRCRESHLLWIQWCNDSGRDYQFEVIHNYGSGDQIRLHGTDLCFSTVNLRYLELRDCNYKDPLQLWSPIQNVNKFELRPFEQRDWTRDDAYCLSQLHHPKSEELVGLHSCATARDDETLYWSEYHS